MRSVHIIGRKNHGKTTLIVELIGQLRREGVRVGTIKHTRHEHEIDHPGKDSFLHRAAGSDPAAIVSAKLTAVFLPGAPAADVGQALAPWFAGCQLVLVEGNVEGSGPKVEVWRAERGQSPLALERRDVLALVTDDLLPVPLDIPVWARSAVPLVARNLMDMCEAA